MRNTTLKIGTQEWMSENLNFSSFRNGDPIPQAKSAEEWVRAGEKGKPAWCYYQNDPEDGKRYGKLYNWYAVQDLRCLAPEGWHIPSDAEWQTLVDSLGGPSIAGSKMRKGKHYKGETLILEATDESGFSAPPGGFRLEEGHDFGRGLFAYFWSSTESDGHLVYIRSLSFTNSEVSRLTSSKNCGYSVRCVRD